MDASILLARLIGPVLVVVGLAALWDPGSLRAVAREFIDSRALLYLAGIMTLLAGLAIVNTHNRWAGGWPAIITAYGWLAIVGGIVRLAFPQRAKAMGEAMLARPGMIRFSGAGQLALGALLSAMGYL